MKRTRIVLVLCLLTGCAGLIGVPDLTLDESPADGGGPLEAGPLGDGNVVVPPGDGGPKPLGDTGAPDGATTDAQVDAGPSDSATCDLGKVQTDPLNCGACGTSCLGGECMAGACQAFALANVASAPFTNIVEHGPSIYVSTFTTFTTQTGGIFVVPKAGGAAVDYVNKANAETMVIIGNTLYFMVDEAEFDDAGKEGGLWKCDLNGPIPCKPVLVAPSDQGRGLSTDKGYIYYADDSDDAGANGIKRIAPEAGAKPTMWRPGYGFVAPIFLSDETFNYTVSIFSGTEHVSLLDIFPDAGDFRVLSTYTKPNASQGQLEGTANALDYTAYDFQTTAGGVVRRVSRPNTAGTTPCDYAGAKNVRPRGLHLADNRLYWTNQGTANGSTPGSVDYCPLDGCCTDATVVWTGTGEPAAVTTDDQAIYWSTRDGSIYKIRKP